MFRHVVWVVLENHSYGTIVGSPDAPYLNRLIRECGLATNYHNVSHPSLPNYVAMTSGLPLAALGPFTADCDPGPGCQTPAASLFAQVPSWKAYEQSMPGPCARVDAGWYAVRHNPPPYYTTLAGCGRDDVPYSRLAGDLRAGTLPAFGFVTPDTCADMHSCPISVGDAWLAANLPGLLGSSEYRAGGMAVFITWDEGEGGVSNDCARSTTDVGCHVATIVVSPYTRPGTTSAAFFDHYSLLRTTEELLGVHRLLGAAATAASMRRAFDL